MGKVIPRTIVFRDGEATDCLKTDDLRDLIYQACGAATAPLLQDNPDYAFPAERVAEAISDCLKELGHGHLVHRPSSGKTVDLTRRDADDS